MENDRASKHHIGFLLTINEMEIIRIQGDSLNVNVTRFTSFRLQAIQLGKSASCALAEREYKFRSENFAQL